MTSSVLVPPDEVGGVPKTTRDAINIQILDGHSAFFGLREFFPEDILWRRENPRTPAMICLQDDLSCTCPWGCVVKLAVRCSWLFEKLTSIQQVFLLFNRGEKPLKRRVPPEEVNNDLTKKERESFKTVVPRMFALHVERNFHLATPPFRLFRVNYNSLELLLGKSVTRSIETPLAFWTGNF